MEFPFNIAQSMGLPSDGGQQVGRVDEKMLSGPRGGKLCEVLDAMGKRSQIAQGLKKPVTLGTPYQSGQRIYLLADARTALGILKVGTKRLFVTPPASSKQSDSRENLIEINPVCALDFYVHESCQRGGFGRKLFDTMLQHEGLRPAKIAYDRPSSKFTGFLRKHFGLSSFTPQNNNFVVFDQFFKGEGSERVASRERSSLDGGRGGTMGILPGNGPMGRAAALHDRPPPMPQQQQQQQLLQQTLQQQQHMPMQQSQQFHPQAMGQSQVHRSPAPEEHGGTPRGSLPFAASPASPLRQPPSAQAGAPVQCGGLHGGSAPGLPPHGGGMPPRDDGRSSRSGVMSTPWGTDRDNRDLRARPRGLASTGSSCGRAPSADPRAGSTVPAGMVSGGRPPRSSSLPASRGGHGGSSSRFASPLSHAGLSMVGS